MADVIVASALAPRVRTGETRSVWGRVLDVIFPAQCAACNAIGSGLCARCFLPGPPVARRLTSIDALALGLYRGALRDAVLAVKDGRRDVARTLATLLAPIGSIDAVYVPVPTTARRLRERGVDGVRLIAEAMATPARVAPLLVQTKGDAQRGRSRADRLGAVGRFRVVERASAVKNVVLVDDVITSGATLEDCAAALRSAGYFVSRAIAVAMTETDVEKAATNGSTPWKPLR